MLAELSREKSLRYSANCITEWVLLDRNHSCSRDTHAVPVKTGFVNGGFCLIRKD